MYVVVFTSDIILLDALEIKWAIDVLNEKNSSF